MCGRKANSRGCSNRGCRRPQSNYILPDLEKALTCIGHSITAVHDVRFRRTDVQGSDMILEPLAPILSL